MCVTLPELEWNRFENGKAQWRCVVEPDLCITFLLLRDISKVVALLSNNRHCFTTHIVCYHTVNTFPVHIIYCHTVDTLDSTVCSVYQILMPKQGTSVWLIWGRGHVWIKQTQRLLPQIKDTYVSYTYTRNQSHISILFIHVSSVIRNLVVRQLLFLSEK